MEIKVSILQNIEIPYVSIDINNKFIRLLSLLIKAINDRSLILMPSLRIPFSSTDLINAAKNLNHAGFKDGSSLTQISKQERIDNQITSLKNQSLETTHKNSFKLPYESLALAIPEVSGLYHTRTKDLNKELKFFYADVETEKPNIRSIQELPREQQSFYYNRHIGKRGRNLFTDEPIEGRNNITSNLKSSPLLTDQGMQTRLIRGEAATATVDHYTNINTNKGHYINNLYAHVKNQLDPKFLEFGGKIHLVRPTRDHYSSDATLNFFTFCTQTELCSTLNHLEATSAKQEKRPAIVFTDNKTCIGLSRTARTEATPIGRLVQQAYFTTDDIDKHDKVVIVDDHVQAGGSVLAMASALKDAEANILGVACLTTHPYCKSGFNLDERVSKQLDEVMQKWDPKGIVLKSLQNFGLHPSALTNAEAMILIAYATDPTVDKNQVNSIDKFMALENYLIQGTKVMEGEHDSLAPIMNQKPLNPEIIVEDIVKCSTETRKAITPTPIKDLKVLDWDCLLVNEKTMNYQLLVNALFSAADSYKDEHPEIQSIADAVKPHIGGELYQDGMPKICMGQDKFASYGIKYPSFFKKDVPIDLVENLHTIAPHINLTSDQKNAVVSILQKEFKRQYKQFLRQGTPEYIQPKKPKIDLPFNDIKIEFMPGAEDFLKQNRQPGSLLVLISNKGDNDLHHEVNKLGIAHMFDHISGVSSQTIGDKVKNMYSKPLSTRLSDVLEHFSLHNANIPISLYGDQSQDILQAASLNKVRPNITGFLVNKETVNANHIGQLGEIRTNYLRKL